MINICVKYVVGISFVMLDGFICFCQSRLAGSIMFLSVRSFVRPLNMMF